jgi:hypothetical protein
MPSRATRRWFTKRDGEVSGPFEEEALLRTVLAGKLLLSTLVRMDGESEWRRLSDVPELRDRGVNAHAGLATAPNGNYGIGLTIGLLTGVIGFVCVRLSTAATETKRGARNGMWIQWLALLALKAAWFMYEQQKRGDL